MNPQTAKTQFYTLNGHTTAWPEYVKKLAERDDMEMWAHKPTVCTLSSKLPPKTILKKSIIKRWPGIILP